MTTTKTAEEVIAHLGLKPHPEGGYFRETFRDEGAHQGRAHSTAILYLLRAGEVSRWHRDHSKFPPLGISTRYPEPLRFWPNSANLNGHVKQRRMTLGLYPAMSVQEAHDAWRKARDLVQAGRDPQAVADNALPAKSVEGVVEEWLRRDQAQHRSGKAIASRFRNYVLPAWQNRLITDIDRRACLDLIDAIADRGTVVLARRIFSHLHRLFVWAIGRGIIEANPLQHAEKPGTEVSRDRVLSDAELVKLWNAAEQLLAIISRRLPPSRSHWRSQAGDRRFAVGRGG